MAGKSAEAILDCYRPLVDAEIVRALASRGDFALYEMMRYHLGLAAGGRGAAEGLGGKRVRAALCLLACEAAGGTAAAAAPAAAGIELLHSFTLLHDDVADRDELRRGRETAWLRWGVGHAITAGDGLFALANLALGRLAEVGAESATLCAVMQEFNEAALVVCEGQQLDLAYEGRGDVGVEAYLAMIERKTAALLAAATGIGARVAGAAAGTVEGLRSFGRHLGMAYQIRDDVLGIWGEPGALGKPVASDLRRNKRSLPIVHALEAAGEGGELADLLRRGVGSDEEAARAAAQMEELGCRAFCERAAEDALARALEELAALELRARPARELRVLARYSVERVR